MTTGDDGLEAVLTPKQAKKQAKAQRPWYKKKRFIIGGAIVTLVIIGNVAGPPEDKAKVDVATAADAAAKAATAPKVTEAPSTTATPRRAATTTPPTTAPPATAPPTTEPPAPRETVSQKNARQKGADYLDYSAFSRTGLIQQLEYEGFSPADATYGVDALNVDWNTQAAKKAADYLDYSSFSHSGLVQQLVYEGFTQAQAEYGVGTTGL